MVIISYGELCPYAQRDPGLYLGTRTLQNRAGYPLAIEQFRPGRFTAAFWRQRLPYVVVANAVRL